MAADEIREGVAPHLLPDLGLPYGGSDSVRDRTSATGVRLRVEPRCNLPFPKDRLPLFFLAALACIYKERWLTLSAIIRWVGKRKENRWRKPQLEERLRRLFGCEIDVPVPGGMKRFRIVDFSSIDAPGDKLFVRFSREFREAARNGVEVAREHVHGLSMHMFAMEVYTKLQLIIHDGIWQPGWDLMSEIRFSGDAAHFSDRLKKALELIRSVWPECPFLHHKVRYVVCDYYVFRRMAYGIEPEEERRAFALEIAGMKRSQVHAHILAQPEWRRAVLFGRYLNDWMYAAAMELVNKTAVVVRHAAGDVQVLEARTASMREIGAQAESASSGLRAVAGLLTAGAAEPMAAEMMDDGPSDEDEQCIDAMDIVAPEDVVSASAMIEAEPVPAPTTTLPANGSALSEASAVVEAGPAQWATELRPGTAESAADIPVAAAPESVPTSSESSVTASVIRRAEAMAGRIVAHVIDTYRARGTTIPTAPGEATEQDASYQDAVPARWLPRTVKRAVTAMRARGRSLVPWRRRTDDGSAGPSG